MRHPHTQGLQQLHMPAAHGFKALQRCVIRKALREQQDHAPENNCARQKLSLLYCRAATIMPSLRPKTIILIVAQLSP